MHKAKAAIYINSNITGLKAKLVRSCQELEPEAALAIYEETASGSKQLLRLLKDLEAEQIRYIPPDGIIEKDILRSTQIKRGLKNAKRLGKKLGAPKKNKNRRGKVKLYDKNQIDQIQLLLKQNRSYREIVKLVDFNITIGTITNIKEKLAAGNIQFIK